MQKGFTIWFTGLPSSGKSTIAERVARILRERELRVEVLDGDEVRKNLSKGLGFSREDRDTNIRRIGWVCQLLARNGVVAIGAAISPFREVRDEVRRMHAPGAFVETYVSAPVKVCAERDVKGLYKKAFAGEITNMTGVQDPYEPPVAAEVVLESHRESVEASAAKLVAKIEELGLIPTAAEPSPLVYTPEEEKQIQSRLESLGYL